MLPKTLNVFNYLMFVFLNHIKEINSTKDSEVAKKAMTEECTPKTMRKLMHITQNL